MLDAQPVAHSAILSGLRFSQFHEGLKAKYLLATCYDFGGCKCLAVKSGVETAWVFVKFDAPNQGQGF